jgi:hypothetical protein
MKIFEVMYLLLIAGLVFGVPVAGSVGGPDGLQYAGIVALIVIVLLVLNFVIERLVSRRVAQRKLTRQ